MIGRDPHVQRSRWHDLPRAPRLRAPGWPLIAATTLLALAAAVVALAGGFHG